MKKGVKIALILGVIVFCLATVTVLLTLRGKFFAGYYLAYEVNTDKETCTITKCIPFGAKEISVPETIKGYRVSEIGSYAFANRAKLTGVSLPDGLEAIGMGAFYECNSLASISIPNSVTSIGSYSFFNCEGLTSITLSANAKDIGARVFEGCTGLTAATVPASAIGALPAENITSVQINGGTSIGNYAFKNFKNLTSITIAPSIEKIGIGAFTGCKNIMSATVPADLVSYIPRDKLTHIVLNGGTHIPEKAFYYYNNLTSITLPDGIVSIGSMAFEGCYKLVEIFNFSDLEITMGSLDNGGIGRYALQIYTSPEEVSTTWVDENGYLFYENGDVCYLLGYMGKETELTLPADCNGKEYAIREYAFNIHTRITAITIPEGVVEIGAYAFAHCRGLVDVTFPDRLVGIGEYAFYECDELAAISLGKNIAKIGAFAFDECYNLSRVSFRGTTEEWSRVEQGYCWIFYAPATEVICTDGTAPLK